MSDIGIDEFASVFSKAGGTVVDEDELDRDGDGVEDELEDEDLYDEDEEFADEDDEFMDEDDYDDDDYDDDDDDFDDFEDEEYGDLDEDGF